MQTSHNHFVIKDISDFESSSLFTMHTLTTILLYFMCIADHLTCIAAPVVPVVISVGIDPDGYITEYVVVNDTGNTITLDMLVSSVFTKFFAS